MLTAGSRLGPYEILSALGAGGMGEVYRARDTKLGRDVALKVLPESVASDPERLARLHREATVLASLNHPNIAAIYGFEDSNATHALVMELVEGPTLADIIGSGLTAQGSGGLSQSKPSAVSPKPARLPLDDALKIARQIAKALEAAHEQGIIHRDLKPANIKVRDDGTVKVLDFGLAKMLEPGTAEGRGHRTEGIGHRADANLTASPTLTSPAMMTGVGVILGTAAYMSPEQAKGRPADKRSDIWAFGCVLYEMLTGKHAFKGEDIGDTLAAVLRGEPDWSALPPDMPPTLRAIVKGCLEKDRDERIGDIAAVQFLLRSPSATPAASTSPWAIGSRMRAAVILVTALIAIGLGAAVTMLGGRRAPDPVITRLDVTTEPTTDPFSFALSPDGRQLIFAGSGDNGPQLWLRSFDQSTARPLAGTSNGLYPFWSPDGRSVGFFADAKLKRLDLTGAAVQVLADAAAPRGGSWSPGGIIVFSPTASNGLMKVAATGGSVTPVTDLRGATSHRWPHFLPDGRQFLFTSSLSPPDTRGIYVASLDGGESKRLLATESAAAYVPQGFLLQVSSQAVLLARRFDLSTLSVGDDPVVVAREVGFNNGNSMGGYTVSSTGVLAYRTGVASARQLVWLDRTGKIVSVVSAPDDTALSSPQLAPDDSNRFALTRVVNGNGDVWSGDSRGIVTRLTTDWAVDSQPVWSSDSARIMFRSSRKDGRYDLFEKAANGAEGERLLFTDEHNKAPLSASPDGRFLLYAQNDEKNQTDLWVLPLQGDTRKPLPVAQTAADEVHGRFSPDGHWIAYTSNETGRYEVFIRPFPESGGKFQVSTKGGFYPRWRPDGKELFFVAPDNAMMAAAVQPKAEAPTGAPVRLFGTQMDAAGNNGIGGYLSVAQYDVSRDGRFLVIVNTNSTMAAPITIVLNWDAGLKK